MLSIQTKTFPPKVVPIVKNVVLFLTVGMSWRSTWANIIGVFSSLPTKSVDTFLMEDVPRDDSAGSHIHRKNKKEEYHTVDMEIGVAT